MFALKQVEVFLDTEPRLGLRARKKVSILAKATELAAGQHGFLATEQVASLLGGRVAAKFWQKSDRSNFETTHIEVLMRHKTKHPPEYK